ncbi:MAG: imidazole glycerol phosphate synthase subunit HisH [Alphaproteobacteria bacterium]|nr:imidazole glycerol phosphate synthase subunit HisH [Alphaproteobacteria bacterium]
MTVSVTVVDYGSGNLLSVCRALRHCGADVAAVETASAIDTADRLVVPGVGAMADSMRRLRERGLIEPIRRYAASNRPLLGICVGMQVMFDASEEFGEHAGLGVIPGRVRRLPKVGVDGRARKIPHIGWNTLARARGVNDWSGTILAGLSGQASAYFLHSYAVEPDDETVRLADCDYEGTRICAAVRRGQLYGCQFHPEKSGEVGLAILRNFLAL